jgi:2-oxo-4-hydroxy-4-carboxy-5-ureidoimidazoline decarboxylase
MKRFFTMDDINAMSFSDFIATFGEVVEHAPWVAEKTYAKRPFRDENALWHALKEVILSEPITVWESILNAHPELSGQEATAGKLTDFSSHEQARLGLTSLSAEHFAHMREFNRRYREKFGFPFVICVKQVADLPTLFREQSRRINRGVDVERQQGIQEVFAIARIRVAHIMGVDH